MQNQDSKNSFILGIAIGVAAISLGGFLFLLVSGNGGFQFQKADGSAVGAGTNTNPSPSPTPTPTPSASGDFSKVSAVTNQDHIRGNKDAKITLIEYSDFQCPYCQRHIPTINQILDTYGDDVRFVYRHFPLSSIHPYAQKAAEASECASEQGKFWEMHDMLFANQSALDVASLKSYAGNLGLNQSQFNSCLDSGKYTAKVNAQLNEGQQAGITGTPGTFVNDQLVKGAYPFDTFKQIIDGLLN